MVVRNGNNSPNVLIGTNQNDILNGLGSNDTLVALAGNDILNGGTGADRMTGGLGNDIYVVDNIGDRVIELPNQGIDTVQSTISYTLGANVENLTLVGNGAINGVGNDLNNTLVGNNTNNRLDGNLGNDTLLGGNGNDTLEGDKGSDLMSGGNGNDLLIWNDGDGSDRMSGGSGQDRVQVNGSVALGDSFTLGRQGNLAIFDRINLVPFKLTVDSAEVFEINGNAGDDSLKVGNLVGTSVQFVAFNGGAGNDSLDATGSNVPVLANGGAGNDSLTGGNGTDTLVGGNPGGDDVDTLTGRFGADRFQFQGQLFTGTPVIAPNGIRVFGKADEIQDYQIGVDKFVLDASDLGMNQIRFQKGNAAQISGDKNVIVLKDTFSAAAVAAKAIADNPNVTSKAGVFVYFNTNLQKTRLVYSENLGAGGKISVLGNLNNQQGPVGINNLSNFTANDFSLVP